MIEINNLTNFQIDEIFLKKVAKKVFQGENKKEGELSIALVGPAIIKKLNKKYRGQNQPTDVLSFSQSPTSNFQCLRVGLGEIIICPQQIRKNAKKFKTDFEKELIFVLIHGILHLLGYEHEESGEKAKKMNEREKYYISKIKA